MHVVFDPDFDGGSWPGPLGDTEARAGESWVGPVGLLSLLETHLGLRAPGTTEAERVAALLPHLRASADGFWRKSFEVDALGVARRLISLRDTSWLHGWRGEPLTPWLSSLSAATAPLGPGLPDRLLAVESALRRRPRVDLTHLRHFVPLAHLPQLWRNVLLALQATGTQLVESQPQASSPAPSSDLHASRAPDFRPRGDGSLLLLRAPGLLAAAEEAAAWLSTLDPRTCVVLSPDAVLDEALARHGVPVTGARPKQPENALLQVLPLTLELAWSPPDPQRALELLTLPQGPIPPSAANALAWALHAQPALGSPRWNEALARALQKAEAADRAAVTQRLTVLLRPAESSATPGRLARPDLHARVALLTQWARGRLERLAEDDPSRPAWGQLLSQLGTFDALLRLCGQAHFSRAELARFLEESTRELPPLPRHEPQAGATLVSTSAALVAPVRHVLWWRFDAQAAATAEPTFPPAERRALRQAGVDLPERAELALRQADRWRRAHLAAQDSLLLVCPERGEDGDERHPHPLWDELQARLADGASRGALVHRSLPLARPERRPRHPQPLPTAARHWRAPGPIPARTQESPSGLESLLGCSLAWTLRYVAQLRGGRTEALRSGERLLGDTVHALLARLLAGPLRPPDDAATEAGRLFDQDAPTLAAALFQPGAEAQRAQARGVTVEAARELYRLLHAWDARVDAVETPLAAPLLGATLEGQPDLVLATPQRPAVIDLKWGGYAWRRDSLQAGSSLQLAAYSRLVSAKHGAPDVPVAYFILSRQAVLTAEPGAFPGALSCDGPGPKETWTGAERAFDRRRAELEQGRLEAAGLPGTDGTPPREESALVDGTLELAAACGFCSYANVCGRAFAGGAA